MMRASGFLEVCSSFLASFSSLLVLDECVVLELEEQECRFDFVVEKQRRSPAKDDPVFRGRGGTRASMKSGCRSNER